MKEEKKRVLIVDDEQVIRSVLAAVLANHGYEVEQAANGKEALALTETTLYDHIVTDINMPVMDGLSLLRLLRQRKIASCITVISAHAEMANIRQAFQLGASDFLAKPLEGEEAILLTLEQAEARNRLQTENARLRAELGEQFTFANLVAKSPTMMAIFQTIRKIADYKTTVLITGESGTGKELIAKAIHYQSCRKDKPLIAVNCGGIPENLLESELFGHLKGAFTDAHRLKKGLFEEADQGTLMLDELGDLPLPLQVKLLRALQEEEIRPLGGSQTIKVDVRIIAATAKNLRQEMEAKRFREDLFYRVNVLAIEVPPLRKRREDIPLLVEHFIAKYNARLGLAIERADPACLRLMLEYSWPGNVRELENIVERCMALAEGPTLTAASLPPEMLAAVARGEEEFQPTSLSIKVNRARLEKTLIRQALSQTNGNKTKAAELLELSLPALLYKIKEYDAAAAEADAEADAETPAAPE